MTAIADDERRWLADQVAGYETTLPRYAEYAVALRALLEQATRELAPLAIVQARPKSLASFAEKAIRKSAESSDPLRQFTDLCGARVITRTHSEVAAVCEWIKHNLEIDWDNSMDTAERLRPAEFGYRSVHYIVSISPATNLGVEIPETVYGLRAEVQVRTMLEHAFADFTHDLSYKREFALPQELEREIAVIAAELEDVDRAFSRVETGARLYKTSYGSFLTVEQIARELRIAETVLEHDDRDPARAWRAGKLAMALGEWSRAIELMAGHLDPRAPELAYQPLLRDLGIALCKHNERTPQGRVFRRGQRYLRIAGEPPYRDPDALAALAGTLKGTDEDELRELYRRAFELDPADYYALTNYLECELRRTGTTAGLAPLGPTIESAIGRCNAHAQVGVNLPWALLSLAELQLLVDKPYECVLSYARAIALTTADWMLEGAIESIERLAPAREDLVGYSWARSMLVIGRYAKFPSANTREQLTALASAGHAKLSAPIVVVAGTTAARDERTPEEYRAFLTEAFGDFDGTIISGGTRTGVSGIVAEIGQRSDGRIRTIGYLPRQRSTSVKSDRRYAEIRGTDSDEFSVLEPLAYWADILSSAIDPAQITVLGIGGGEITAAELRIGLALGARVAVLTGSGGAAARVLSDPDWASSTSLISLPRDPQTARAFVGSGMPRLAEDTRETLGRFIHAMHREEDTPRLAVWDDLPEGLRESSRAQADHIATKLSRLGYEMRPASGDGPPVTFRADEVELLAEAEHGRWNAERLVAGWRCAPEWDAALNTSPYLVPWTELSEEIREWDRAAVRRIPESLAAVGYEIVASPPRQVAAPRARSEAHRKSRGRDR